MPRTKVITGSKTIKPKKKPVKKVVLASKNKKTKKVIVDIIEDDDLANKNFADTAENIKEREEKIYKSLVSEKYEAEPIPSDLDSQKKFFSQLAKETNANKVKNNSSEKFVDQEEKGVRPKQVGLYRKLVWKFLIATAILLAIVFYFSFSKLTLEISPRGEVLNNSLFLKVAKDNISENDNDPRTLILGDVSNTSSSLERVYPASGEEFGAEELNGQVRIINKNNKSQVLVATTRVLSADNKMFRIKDAVNVPAGGEVLVDIYSDKPSQEMAIGPTTFTIPGLWVGLQDKIFARSDKEFTYLKKVKKFVKQTDIENATKDINERLLSNASSSVSNNDNIQLYSVGDNTKITFSAKAGDIKDEFSAKIQSNIVVVSFPKEQAIKLVSAQLKLLVPDEKELIEFKPENIIYTLDSFDSQTNTATVKATFSGVMALKADSTVINREQLVNLTKAQIDNYLKDFPEIKSYELKFYPPFIQKAPSLVDRISIVINKDK